MSIERAVNLEEFTVTHFTAEAVDFLERRKSIKWFSFSEEDIILCEAEVSSERIWKLIDPPRSLRIVADECKYDCEGDCGAEWHVQGWLEKGGDEISREDEDQEDDNEDNE